VLPQIFVYRLRRYDSWKRKPGSTGAGHSELHCGAWPDTVCR